MPRMKKRTPNLRFTKRTMEHMRDNALHPDDAQAYLDMMFRNQATDDLLWHKLTRWLRPKNPLMKAYRAHLVALWNLREQLKLFISEYQAYFDITPKGD